MSFVIVAYGVTLSSSQVNEFHESRPKASISSSVVDLWPHKSTARLFLKFTIHKTQINSKEVINRCSFDYNYWFKVCFFVF